MSQHMTAATHLSQLQIIQNLALNRLMDIVLSQIYDIILRHSGRNLPASHLLEVILVLIRDNIAASKASDWNDHLCIK